MTQPIGTVTRGTTAPNRLRRSDRWLLHVECGRLREAQHPLVVDLGFGASPVTTRELADRLHEHVRADLDVVGLEIDPVRVQQAIEFETVHLKFRRGGFELAGMHANVVRAFNVLRQYDESSVQAAWQQMYDKIAGGGLIIDGTCDEIGRRSAWLARRSGRWGRVPPVRPARSRAPGAAGPSGTLAHAVVPALRRATPDTIGAVLELHREIANL